MKRRFVGSFAPVLALMAVAGCVREPEGRFVSSPQVGKLSDAFKSEIEKVLIERCGTPSAPKLLGSTKAQRDRLALGATVYAKNCRQCHGVTGDGAGPAAAYLLPKPRDYRPGIYKFTSTTYGSKPLREDLARTIKRGIAGTSMPAFRLLPPNELDAVVDYVMALTHRGELESELANAAEFDGAIDPEAVPGMIDGILEKWEASKGRVVYPLTPMPVFTESYITEGKAAFLSKGCSKCHGDDGRGQTADNIGNDSWGNPTKAADLTSGMLRGGTEPLDVYRHISAGINGTPMPSFVSTFSSEPDTMWKLTAYVLALSNTRRNGETPEAGLLKPLPGVGAAATPSTDAAALLPQPSSDRARAVGGVRPVAPEAGTE
ncbi:MAG: c-type cytochrome [Isosphaeraceae bacterium]|nr:c-type cytochrome [Isosphaeraceae bacterium]